MKKIIFIIIASLLYFPVNATITMNAANHPRIFVGSDSGCSTVATLKSRSGLVDDSTSQYQTHSAEYTAVKAIADSTFADTQEKFDALNDTNKGRIGICYAFVYLMTEDSTYLTRSKWYLDSISTFVDSNTGWFALFNSAQTFDWVYGGLTSGERTTYATALSNKLSGSISYSSYNTFPGNYNKRQDNLWLHMLIGQAIYNEDGTTAATYWNRAYQTWLRMDAYSQEIMPGGDLYPIGEQQYSVEAGWLPQLFAYAVMKYAGLTGSEISGLSTDILDGMGYATVYSSIIAGDYIPSAGDMRYNGGETIPTDNYGQYGYPISVMSTMYDGTDRGKLSALTVSGIVVGDDPEPWGQIYEIIFVNKVSNAIGTTLDNIDDTMFFADTSVVYRSGFTLDSDSDDIYFKFEAAKHASGHTNYSKGHMDIWRGRDYLTPPSGSYVDTDPVPADTMNAWIPTAVSKNTFTVFDPTEDEGAYAEEGGQLSNQGDGDGVVHDSGIWETLGSRDPGETCDLGSINRTRSGADFLYSRFLGVSGKLYKATKMDSYSRSVVRVGDFFVVLDRWDGDTATTFKKRQVWQSPSAIEGGSWSGSAPDEVDSTGRNFNWDIGGSRLNLYRAFPAPSASSYNRRIGGGGGGPPEAYQVYSREESVNYSGQYGTESLFGLWRLEFEETGQEDGLFLTVLFPTADTTAMPTIYPLTGSNYRGVEIVAATGNRQVVIFSDDVTETEETGYTFTVTTNTGNADVLVADLASDTYSITGESSQASDNSTVYFTTDLSAQQSFTVSADATIPTITPGITIKGATIQ